MNQVPTHCQLHQVHQLGDSLTVVDNPSPATKTPPLYIGGGLPPVPTKLTKH